MKRHRRIDRIYRRYPWLYAHGLRHPKDVIPPLSVVRLFRSDPKWDWGVEIGATFRIGYYGWRDGFDFVWLVGTDGKYSHSWNQASLLEHFEIVTRSDETDLYGCHRSQIEAIL